MLPYLYIFGGASPSEGLAICSCLTLTCAKNLCAPKTENENNTNENRTENVLYTKADFQSFRVSLLHLAVLASKDHAPFAQPPPDDLVIFSLSLERFPLSLGLVLAAN